MIELTVEQQKSVAREEETPPCVIDPVTHTRYVLVREEQYDRVRRLFDGDNDHFVRDLAPDVMAVFGREGWDDPAMDVYNELDPRINP